jgi:hypothetical protein
LTLLGADFLIAEGKQGLCSSRAANFFRQPSSKMYVEIKECVSFVSRYLFAKMPRRKVSSFMNEFF